VLLSGADCGRLLHAMRVITEELGRKAQSAAPEGAAAEHGASARVVTLRPLGAGDLGWVLQRHGTVYAAEYGWDARLAAARRVYMAAGFTLVSEEPDDAFGDHMMSQTWSRPLVTLAAAAG